MGLASSKVRKQIPQDDLKEVNIPSTPILTPKVVRRDDFEIDPRSPSVQFSRTPIQLSESPLKVTETSETELNPDVCETTGKPKLILLHTDPRSPTVEFKRTPIVINVGESDVPESIRNKTLNRVKQSDITIPKSSCKKVTNSNNIVAPKLIESSPIIRKHEAYKRKSFVGLLETNLDFTETDLDAVIRAKNMIKEGSTPPKCPQLSDIIESNIDPRSPTNEFIRTPIQIIKNNNVAINKNKINVDIQDDSIKQNKIVELQDHNIIEKCIQEICETVHLQDEGQYIENNLCTQPSIQTYSNIKCLDGETDCEDGIDHVETSDCEDSSGAVAVDIPKVIKSAPITPHVLDSSAPKVESKLVEKQIKSAPITPPRVNLPADVKELDKKLTNLIYQDEDIVICPRIVKLKDYDSRSPLRSLNSNEPEKTTSAQKFKRGNKIKKSEYTVSKIPVFKDKTKKTEVQCENTPPRSMEKRSRNRVRRSHWDNADATLII